MGVGGSPAGLISPFPTLFKSLALRHFVLINKRFFLATPSPPLDRGAAPGAPPADLDCVVKMLKRLVPEKVYSYPLGTSQASLFIL